MPRLRESDCEVSDTTGIPPERIVEALRALELEILEIDREWIVARHSILPKLDLFWFFLSVIAVCAGSPLIAWLHGDWFEGYLWGLNTWLMFTVWIWLVRRRDSRKLREELKKHDHRAARYQAVADSRLSAVRREIEKQRRAEAN